MSSSHEAEPFYSWGLRTSRGAHRHVLDWRDSSLPNSERRFLPYGLGRSYGDSGLIDDGWMIDTHQLDHILAFDEKTGLVRCEAGVSISSLNAFSIPRGWFIPVTPGTKYVTVAGCLANDVHGKNHHRAGTFGCHVPRFSLRRSDRSTIICSADNEPGLYSATIGGLGLTGVILWLDLQLRPLRSTRILQHIEPLKGIQAFFDVARRLEPDYEYTVAWLDATYRGEPRGLFIAGNHDDSPTPLEEDPPKEPWALPFTFPNHVVNSFSIKMLNSGFYLANSTRASKRTADYNSFFYPLDSVGNWNRAYGRKGLAQYQFVVPLEHGPEALRTTLGRVQKARQSSFLTVVKLFGANPSPGLLSFPREGVTVCFDLPYLGTPTDRLLEELDEVVFDCAGALYPAKDYRMSRAAFEKSYPRHEKFRAYLDPQCASNFSRRTGITP